MDAQQFLAEFGYVANAPEGVQRLRDLILSFAFRGELVPNGEQSLDALLNDLAAQRKSFSGETRTQRLARQAFESTTSNGSYPLPPNWRWVSLSEVGHTWGQKKPDRDFFYIDVSSIDNKAGVLSSKLELLAASAAPSRARKIVKSGTLIYSTVRPYLLNIAIINREFEREPIASTAFAIVHPWEGIDVRYIYFYLRSSIFVRHVETMQTGVAYPAISDEKFYSALMPLPPTEEQSRIVDKVDELMTLCDQLERQQQARRQLQNALRRSTLQAVAAATSPHEFQTSWHRLAENIGGLFSAPEDVGRLRSLCVELALRGGLTPAPSIHSGDNATQLLNQLAKRKTGKRVAKLAQVEAPFDLPRNWRWALLEDLIQDSESGWSPKCDAEPRRSGEWGVLKVSAVTWGAFRPDENKRLPRSLDPRLECEVKPGDFLMSRANTAELIARSVVVGDDAPDRLLMSDKIVRLNFVDSELKAWVNLVNNSEYARDHYLRNATGTSDSMRNVSRQVIHELPVPFPPESIKDAVLNTLAALTELCDALESQLRNAELQAERLSMAAVASFTGMTIKRENEDRVKAPQTELFAPLRLGLTPDVTAQAPLATILARHQGELSARDLWQRFGGGDVGAFYAQLKTEVAHGWIQEPDIAEMREIVSEEMSA